MSMTVNHNLLPSILEIKDKYPFFDYNKIEWAWEADYYDGPIEGMVKTNGNMYWAFWADDDTEKRRVFIMVDLGKERTEYEEFWNELFDICIGTLNGDAHSPEAKFYYGRREAHYKGVELTDYPIVGWFTW